MKRLLALADQARPAPFAVFLLLLLALRDWQNLLRPMFYAEDGLVWYEQAYTQGWASLANQEGGYLNTVQRLVAMATQPLPLAWAPLLFNLAAYAMMAGVALLLVSPRLDAAWPQRGARRLFAVLFVLMPAAHETAGILTNMHWYLAPFAFLVLASAAPANPSQRLLDAAVLLLSGLSGPFCVFLLPFALHQWLHRRDGVHALRLGLTAAAAVTQLLCLYTVGGGRAVGPLGATPSLFFQIIALIPLHAEMGARVTQLFAATEIWRIPGVGIAIGVLALAAGGAGWRLGTPLLRHFLLFSMLMLAGALYKPLIDLELEQWPIMAFQPPAGGRYYLFPMIAWSGVLFAMAARGGPALKRCAVDLLAVTCLIAIPLDLTLRQRGNDYEAFQAAARAFDAAAPGSRGEFPVRPAFLRHLVLVKK
ncbi:MAG: hypothetical protein JWN73_1092 [Betaproteobacteria bacterium]|nr:hypothetical protein [Betaproteobacteria bacterium]